MGDRIEAIAQAHLSCGYPSRECDPLTAALAAKVTDRELSILIRAIAGYHNPLTRMLVRAFQVACHIGGPSVDG